MTKIEPYNLIDILAQKGHNLNLNPTETLYIAEVAADTMQKGAKLHRHYASQTMHLTRKEGREAKLVATHIKKWLTENFTNTMFQSPKTKCHSICKLHLSEGMSKTLNLKPKTLLPSVVIHSLG